MPLKLFLLGSVCWFTKLLTNPKSYTHASIFWIGWDEMGPVGSVLLSWALTGSQFPPWENKIGPKGSLGTKLCCLGNWVKLFFLLSPVSTISEFLFQQLVCRTTRLPQRLLSMGDGKSQCSPGNLAVQSRGLEPVHGSLQSPWPGPRSWCMCIQTLPRSIDTWGWIPLLPQRHSVSGWLLTCCSCERYMSEAMSYLPILLMSLPNHIFP